jgi:hypothetical protein
MVASNVADLALALQATKGTPAAAAQFRMLLTGGNVGPKRDTADLEETSGSRLKSQAITKGVTVAGSPVFYVRPGFIGALLYAALGAKATTGSVAPYSHVFTVADELPWLTLWRMLGDDLIERFSDSKLKSLTIESKSGEALKATAEVLGCTVGGNATSQSAIDVEIVDTFMHSDGRGALKFEGSAVSSISDIKVKIATGAVAMPGDSLGPDTIAEGMLEITIDTTQTLADFALWNRLHYGDDSPAANAIPTSDVLELAEDGLEFTWTKRADDGTTATPERSLKLSAKRLIVSDISGVEPDAGGAPLKMGVSYKVYEPTDPDDEAFTATLKNATAAYTAA